MSKIKMQKREEKEAFNFINTEVLISCEPAHEYREVAPNKETVFIV